METFFVNCPFCDFEATLQRPEGADIRTSEAVRLHERMIDHLRREHRRGRSKNLSMGVKR